MVKWLDDRLPPVLGWRPWPPHRRTPSTTAPRSPRSASAPIPSGRGRHRRDRRRARGRLPAARHGRELRERDRGRRGASAAPGCRATRSLVASKIPGRHHAYDDAIASVRESLEPPRPRAHRPAPHPLAQPEPGQVRRGVAGAGPAAEGRPGPLHRRLQLHRGAPHAGSSTTPASCRRSTRSSCTPASRRSTCARCTSGSASAPRRGARWASAARPSRRTPSPRPPRRTASPPARSSCAGTSSSARCRSPSPPTRSARRRTSTSSASSSPTTRWRRSPALAEDDGRLFGGDPDTHEEM